MTSDGTTIGIWIGADDDVLREFDDVHECGPDHAGSRSDAIKEAMRLSTAVEETIEEFPYDLDGAPLRHQVQQALIEQDRREATMDE